MILDMISYMISCWISYSIYDTNDTIYDKWNMLCILHNIWYHIWYHTLFMISYMLSCCTFAAVDSAPAQRADAYVGGHERVDEHDDRRRGEVDSQFAEMIQHWKIRYGIVLQAKTTDVIGRIRDRLIHICHERQTILAGCIGLTVKRHMSLANEK
jgi:hypothetical protein